MNRGAKAFLVGMIALAAVPASARAGVVTFQNQSIPILLNAGPQTEGDFQYRAIDGAWEVQTTYGNPASALATFFNSNTSTDFSFTGQRFEITRVGGGQFTFSSVDFSTISTSNFDQVSIVGYLGGVSQHSIALTTSTSTPNAFSTAAFGFANALDQIVVTLSFAGTHAMMLDNFNLTKIDNGNGTPPTATPEPGTLALSVIGLGLMAVSLRRRGRAQAS